MEGLFETNGDLGYQLIESEVPTRVKTETPVYDDILKDFGSSTVKCAKVFKPGVQPATISNELRKSRKRLSPDYDNVEILLRKDEGNVYLLRK
jgi:hypothetical protein